VAVERADDMPSRGHRAALYHLDRGIC
jgi:hypothetical protein